MWHKWTLRVSMYHPSTFSKSPVHGCLPCCITVELIVYLSNKLCHCNAATVYNVVGAISANLWWDGGILVGKKITCQSRGPFSTY